MDLSVYRGSADDIIRVLASDAIEVVGVTVALRRSNDTPIEAGPAVKDHDLWIYRCAATSSGSGPITVEVTAHNRADAKAIEKVPAVWG